jgi:hypothetical protein
MDGVLRSFQSWMDGGGDAHLIAWSIALFLVAMVSTLVHELGHASVALVRTDGPVRVQVGREPAWFTFRLGRLVLTLDPRSPTRKVAGYAAVAGRLSPRERLCFALAGPAAQAGFGALIVASGHLVVGTLVAGSAALCLVPRQVGRLRSDGWHALDALRGNGVGLSPEEATAARARSLFDTPAQHLAPRRRELAAIAGDDPTILRAAFAGWCWREAQRSDLGDAAHAARVHREATVESAARQLAESGATFGLLFEAGLLGALVPGSDLERQRTAFRYGGALREIERARS